MKLNFDTLTKALGTNETPAIEKTVGTLGTTGTASIHAGLRVPKTSPALGDNGDNIVSTSGFVPNVPKVSPSHNQPESQYSCAVPNVPVVPGKKHSTEEMPTAKPSQSALHQLEFFRFDEFSDTLETERINNMAWEFMQADGMNYADAIRVASEIAAHCRVAACEAAYENVRALWERLQQRQAK